MLPPKSELAAGVGATEGLSAAGVTGSGVETSVGDGACSGVGVTPGTLSATGDASGVGDTEGAGVEAGDAVASLAGVVVPLTGCAVSVGLLLSGSNLFHLLPKR